MLEAQRGPLIKGLGRAAEPKGGGGGGWGRGETGGRRCCIKMQQGFLPLTLPVSDHMLFMSAAHRFAKR